MPPRGAPNPMEMHHRPVPSGQDLMADFQKSRAQQAGPMPMAAPMAQQQMIHNKLNEEFKKIHVKQNQQNGNSVVQGAPKGPMQVMPPPQMFNAPPPEMVNMHARMYDQFVFNHPPMMQNQFPFQMQRPMPQPQQQQAQQPQQPKQAESKEKVREQQHFPTKPCTFIFGREQTKKKVV